MLINNLLGQELEILSHDVRVCLAKNESTLCKLQEQQACNKCAVNMYARIYKLYNSNIQYMTYTYTGILHFGNAQHHTIS